VEHVHLVSDKLATGIGVELGRGQLADNFEQKTLSFLESDLLINAHNQRIVVLAQAGLAHLRAAGKVLFIEGESEGLDGLSITGQRQLGGRLGLDVDQLEVLNRQTLNGFSLVTQGLGNQAIHGLDALDEESMIIDLATQDPNHIDVLF